MTPLLIAFAALAAALILVLALRALAGSRRVRPCVSEAVLLEEAVVTEPVAPGLEGKAEVRKRGADPLQLRVRASDAAQVFARGSKVRVIDLRDGLGIVEAADEEHLVR
jgi:hypothetical protein